MSLSDKSHSGTVAAWLFLPWPWPHKTPITLIHRRLNGLRLRVTSLEDGRVQARLARSDDTTALETVSCPITATEPPFVFLAVAWELPDDFRIHVNDAILASNREPGATPSTYAVPKRPKSCGRHDFTRESAGAEIKRRGRFHGTATANGKLPGTKATVLRDLREHTAQLSGFIERVDAGDIFYYRSIANSAGLMLAEGRPLPLIQLAATMTDTPLTIYTIANPTIPIPLSPDSSVLFDATASPDEIYDNPIDLDAWLTLTAATLDGREFTHRQVISAIRNAQGSHSDLDVVPLIEMLQSTSSAAVNGLEWDLLVEYVRNSAAIASVLAQRILSRS